MTALIAGLDYHRQHRVGLEQTSSATGAYFDGFGYKIARAFDAHHQQSGRWIELQAKACTKVVRISSMAFLMESLNLFA